MPLSVFARAGCGAPNRADKSTIKTQLRKVGDLLTAGKVDAATAEFPLTAKKLDQAAAKGVIHANAAARLKSRLSRRIKTASQPAPTKT